MNTRILGPACAAAACAVFALALLHDPARAAPSDPEDTSSADADGDPAPPAPPRPVRIGRAIYVCAEVLPVTFADRPCSPGAELRQIKVLAPPPGRAPAISPGPAAAAPRPAAKRPPESAAPDEREQRCRRLLAQREALDDRMRTGYSAQQAGQLWNRWRDLGREIYAARC
jgi:hypothetical protein